jgi:hypothetical protein
MRIGADVPAFDIDQADTPTGIESINARVAALTDGDTEKAGREFVMGSLFQHLHKLQQSGI